MEEKRYCYNCFCDLEPGSSDRCPNCGYDPAYDRGKYPLALPHGSILNGKYITGRVLGQGGFGITYIARDWHSQQKVAIKEYFPYAMATRMGSHSVSAYSDQRGDSFEYGKNCFLEEAKTLAQFIGNQSIVRIYSYFEENATAYFVMEYLEGASLSNYLKRYGGKISWEETKRLLLPVMDALGAVHNRGIIHRDVKPDNIFVMKDGTAKLLDFGAARYDLGERSGSLDVILTPGYAAREQYSRRGHQGSYTDVYSLAVCCYRSITGVEPPDSIDRLDNDDLAAPSRLGVSIPQKEEEAILRGMSIQPADRFQNMDEFKKAIVDRPSDQFQDMGEMNGAVANRKVTGIQLSQYSLNLKLGESFRLSADVSPNEAANKNLVWDTSDYSVASVDQRGLVTGRRKGQAEITCKAEDGSGTKSVCTVAVGRIFIKKGMIWWVAVIELIWIVMLNFANVNSRLMYESEKSLRSSAENQLDKVETQLGEAEKQLSEAENQLDKVKKQISSIEALVKKDFSYDYDYSEYYYPDRCFVLLSVGESTTITVCGEYAATYKVDSSSDNIKASWFTDFDEESKAEVKITAESTGEFFLSFTNDENDDSFEVLVLVME